MITSERSTNSDSLQILENVGDIDRTNGAISPTGTLKKAWTLVRSDYAMLFVISIVGIILASIVPVILTGPFICGIYLCYLDKYDGRELKLERLFAGFQFFWPSMVVVLAVLLPFFVVLAIVYIPLLMAAGQAVAMSEAEFWRFLTGLLAFEAVAAFVMVCFHTLLFFSIPLVVDRRLSGFAAIKLSCRTVWNNLSGIVGLMAIGMAISILGYLMICVGIYFVMPVLLALNVVAYRRLFPAAA